MPERTVRTRVGVSKTSTGKMSTDNTIEVSSVVDSTQTETELEAQSKMVMFWSRHMTVHLLDKYPAE